MMFFNKRPAYDLTAASLSFFKAKEKKKNCESSVFTTIGGYKALLVVSGFLERAASCHRKCADELRVFAWLFGIIYTFQMPFF